MESFEATLKKWGNSMGIVVPRDICEKIKAKHKKKLKFYVEDGENMDSVWEETFGTLPKTKRSTQEILDEMDAENNEEW